MATSTLHFLLIAFLVLYISVQAKSGTATPAEFIKSSCDETTYPELCVQSLSIYATAIQQSPRQLTQTALSVSLTKAQLTQTFMSRLRKFKGLQKREYAAIADCLNEMGDTVDRLTKSVKELNQMSGSKKSEDFLWHISNVQTWVSAALTDENTCLDGFSDRLLDGKIKGSVRSQILHVAQITSNALALINKFAET